ncbi:Similar to Grid1: Glutamate receptor ionotropic, partial [Cotesia congregata]
LDNNYHCSNLFGKIVGIEDHTRLKNLLVYLSTAGIRTAIMNIKKFITELLAPWIDMAYPTWLTFFNDETSIYDFFRDIYVPFDCNFMISKRNLEVDFEAEIITEVYQIYRGLELRHGVFATWNIVSGATYTKYSLYQRRSNLHGHTLRVISLEDPPFSEIIRDKNNNVIGLKGFFGGIMDLLKESLNCTLTYQTSNEWGYLLENGTWTGAMSTLIDNKTDIFAAELLMTRDRLDSLKFTTPLYSTKSRAFIKKPASSMLSWDKYITPFATGIWSALGIIILVSSASITIIKSIAVVIHLKNVENDKADSKFLDVVFSILGALCSQGMELSLLNPIRIVQFSIHVTAVVILAAYSAALISSLAVKVFVLPFTTMEGLLQDRTYRFEGLSKVCSEDKYAFMSLDAAVSQLKSSVHCTLVPLDTISQASIGMALGPDCPFRGIINNNILLLRDSGLLNKLLHSDWALPGDNIKSEWATVEINDVLPLIVVLIVSNFVSVFIMCGEKLMQLKLARNR